MSGSIQKKNIFHLLGTSIYEFIHILFSYINNVGNKPKLGLRLGITSMYLHRFNRTIRTKNNLEFPQITASIVSDNVVAAKSARNKKVHLIAEGVCRGRSVERRLGRGSIVSREAFCEFAALAIVH